MPARTHKVPSLSQWPPDLTWSQHSLRANPGCHAEGVLAAVHCHPQGRHHCHHGLAGIGQSRPLPWELGCPHPVRTAFHILGSGKDVGLEKRDGESGLEGHSMKGSGVTEWWMRMCPKGQGSGQKLRGTHPEVSD